MSLEVFIPDVEGEKGLLVTAVGDNVYLSIVTKSESFEDTVYNVVWEDTSDIDTHASVMIPSLDLANSVIAAMTSDELARQRR